MDNLCDTCIHHDVCFEDFDDKSLPQDEVSIYERCCVGCGCCGGFFECLKDSHENCEGYEEVEAEQPKEEE